MFGLLSVRTGKAVHAPKLTAAIARKPVRSAELLDIGFTLDSVTVRRARRRAAQTTVSPIFAEESFPAHGDITRHAPSG